MISSMSVYDIGACLIAAFLVVRELFALGLNYKVKIPGKASGRIAANVILCVIVCVLILVKLSAFNFPYIAPCGMALFLIIGFFVKSGVGSDGIVSAGKNVPFSDMEFYAIDYEDEKGFRLRVHTYAHEYVLSFRPELKEEIVKLFDGRGVKFATFTPGKNEKNEN